MDHRPRFRDRGRHVVVVVVDVVVVVVDVVLIFVVVIVVAVAWLVHSIAFVCAPSTAARAIRPKWQQKKNSVKPLFFKKMETR